MTESMIAIIGVCVFMIVREVLASRERVVMEKIRKAKDINEVLSLDVSKKEVVEIEESPYVDVADMPDLPMDK